MGQVALGLRSLLVKAAIFFVMCALLVWALGGQLFPSPEIVDREPVHFDGKQWFWRLYAGGDEPNAMHWNLMVQGDGKPVTFGENRWEEPAALFVVNDVLYFAGRSHDLTSRVDPWILTRMESDRMQSWSMPTRLELETWLEKARSGQSLQDLVDKSQPLPSALDRASGTADESHAPAETTPDD